MATVIDMDEYKLRKKVERMVRDYTRTSIFLLGVDPTDMTQIRLLKTLNDYIREKKREEDGV